MTDLIEEEIRARHQRPTETFQDYLTALLTLMRRGKELNASERVERVCRNMRSEYKLCARRDAFNTLKELAAEYEQIQKETMTAPGEMTINEWQLCRHPGMTTKGHIYPSGSKKRAQEQSQQEMQAMWS
ncbi:hypothetical protein QE152_g29884 [Popillia japonica]|uniref:Gag protein n=1 Tax=Popillia japonica TaxID=7064 RepID=A0AAW1JGT4_POPJA